MPRHLLRKYQLLAAIVHITTIEKKGISIVDLAFLEKNLSAICAEELQETQRPFGIGAFNASKPSDVMQ
jgi:hypothetical protein